jgi:hypothetical protein
VVRLKPKAMSFTRIIMACFIKCKDLASLFSSFFFSLSYARYGANGKNSEAFQKTLKHFKKHNACHVSSGSSNEKIPIPSSIPKNSVNGVLRS